MAKKKANSFVLTIAGITAATVIGVVGVNLTPAPHVIFSLAPSAEPQVTAEPEPISCVLAGTGQVVDFADVVFLAVKPQFLEGVLNEIKDSVKEKQIFISIAPGKTLQWLGEHLGEKTKVIRTMPNTPAMVGEGMTALCVNELVTEKETELAVKLCDTFGKTEVIPEHLMDAVVGVSGSSPAYVFMFLEAMADAAVADGMPRAQAYKFAAQSVLGSAKLMLETGKHPGELKDMVCSPAGTTIQAVRVLEEKGMRSAVIEAMKACVKKGREM